MEDLEDERVTGDGAFDAVPKHIVPVSETGRARPATPLNFEATRWAHLVPILRPVQKALLLVLARHADLYGCSWCSQKTLAAQAGCCDRSVRSVFRGFESRGLIRRIGRMGAHGGQLTDVVVLTGWPGRTLIPDTGHPKLGRFVKETPETRLQWMHLGAQARTELPPEAASAPDQNKNILITNTTLRYDRVLEECFEALGSWATAKNMQHLVDDLPTLLNWLEQGVDLQRQVLPVLAKKAKSEGEIPEIKTWRYFKDALKGPSNRRRVPVRGSNGTDPAGRQAIAGSTPTLRARDGREGFA